MRGHVFFCGPFDVDNASAHVAQGIAGVAQPSTTVGFVHALSLDVGRHVTPDLHVVAGGVIVHEANFLAGHAKFPPSDASFAQKSGKGPVPGPEVLDETLLRARVTFVLLVEHRGDRDDAEADLEALSGRLAGMVLAKRYAGGSLHAGAPLGGLVTGPHAPSEVGARMRRAGAGFMLVDRIDHLRDEVAKGSEHLDVILDTVAFKPRDGGGFERVVKGALAPVAVGYRAIEAPRGRRTNRSSAPDRLHVYADNMISVGQWTHVRRLSRADEPLKGCLWAPFVDEALGLYYASAVGPVTAGSLPSNRT